MKSSETWKYLAIALLVSGCAAMAQEPQLKTAAQGGPAAVLSLSLKRDITPGRRVTVVTVAQPTARQQCRVEGFDADKIVCAGTSEAKSIPVTYRGEDLVAVIRTDGESHLLPVRHLLTSLGFGGGAIAGAALLAATSMVAAIPLAVIGSIFVLEATFHIVDRLDEKPHERVLYQNPTQLLLVDLK